ncbi:uncharacterized protein LOC130621986 [Hydractinia symbiolongicarpus]|uniref:uncharacterized protein LOC130621986 n=1 Tax=Hydractinia symbiolongicarpus TaxID=13093 RepID=UPI00254F69B4|nr:uncharacterized protein LOC130621986 [Hydractinia symbiolongicarpus]
MGLMQQQKHGVQLSILKSHIETAALACVIPTRRFDSSLKEEFYSTHALNTISETKDQYSVWKKIERKCRDVLKSNKIRKAASMPMLLPSQWSTKKKSPAVRIISLPPNDCKEQDTCENFDNAHECNRTMNFVLTQYFVGWKV